MERGCVIIADPDEKGYSFAQGVFEKIMDNRERNFKVSLIDLKKTTFKDGEFKLKIAQNIREQSCFYIHDPNVPASEWVSRLLFSLNGLASSSPGKITVVLPYMRFARQDRKDESRVSVSSKAVCDVMAFYAQRGLSIDLHAPQIQQYPRSKFTFDNLSSAPVVADHLVKNHEELLDELVLVSPDLGGGKRLEGFQKSLERRGVKAGIALGHKTRAGDNFVKSVQLIGEVGGKNCIIIDDIIDTGGTMVETGKVLREAGAESVSCYGTFGLFSDGLEKFGEFDKVMTSDLLNQGNEVDVEIISMKELFGQAIFRSHTGESLSSLFG